MNTVNATPYLDDMNEGEWIEPNIHQGTGVFSLYDSQSMTPNDLLAALLGNIAGINILPGSVNFIGADRSASTFASLDFGQSLNLLTPGVLLTSGDGAPALTNTESSYSLSNSLGKWIEYDEPFWEEYPTYDENGDPVVDEEGNPVMDGDWVEGYWEQLDTGDEELTAIAQAAFEGAGTTQDASILEFSFTVTDESIRSINLDVLFGSEEYPYYINSSFVDIAAVIVNGQNYAYIDGDVTKPLSIVGATVEDGRFIDNTVDFYEYDTSDTDATTAPSQLAIEYNGLTPKLTISIPLNEEDNTYHVRLGVADTGDAILDSGLFLTNFRALTSQYEGTLVNVEASDEGSELSAPSPNTATLFVGGAGNDTMTGSTAADVYDISKGGSNTVKGNAEQLNGDTVVGFSEQDSLSISGASFGQENLTVTMGSAILDIDTNKDGNSDTTIRLEGDFSNGVFTTLSDEDATDILFIEGNRAPESTRVINADDTSITIASTEKLVKLLGDTSGRVITIEKGAGAMNLSAGSQVVLEGVNEEDIRIVRDGTTLLVQDTEANLLVQVAASSEPSYIWLEDGYAMLSANTTEASLQFADVTLATHGSIASHELFELSDHAEIPEGIFVGVSIIEPMDVA